MSGIYFKFLFATTIKKRPVWITWLLYVLTITMFIIVLPVAAGINPYQIWANTTMAVCQTFLGMAVAIFTAVLAINVFKDSNEEGTELIIISKPISRKKIVFTKFILYIVFCLMVNLCAVVVSIFTIFIPGTEVEFYWGLVVSMFIGNLVCFSIFGSIAILLSSQVAKVGVIITNIIISLVFLIYQILTLFVFKTPLKCITSDNVAPLSFVYAKRNTEDGSYKEKDFVGFDPSIQDDGTFAVKASNWQGFVDYWENSIKSKDVSNMLNITDLAGQVALTYLSVGVNKYSERQARRMFGISRFWDYTLTYPCSPEFTEDLEYSTIKKENKDSLPVIYTFIKEFDVPLGTYGTKTFCIPGRFCFAAVKETRQSSLTGSYGNKVPVGWVRGDTLFSNRDVYLEQDKWNQYKDAFDVIYDTIYDWDLVDGYGDPYYDPTDLQKEIDKPGHTEDATRFRSLWSYGDKNLAKYYELAWAMLSGHSDDNDFLGENTPMTEEMNDSLEVKTVDDLNDRFIQYKYYAYYRAYDEQQEYLNQNASFNDEARAKATVLNEDPEDYWSLMKQLSTEPVENNWYMQGKKNPESIIPLSFLEENTQAPNVHLMIQTVNQMKKDISDPDILKAALIDSTYAKYRQTSHIFDDSVTPNESYLFVSLDSPTRKSTFCGETYSERPSWVPYITNDLLIKLEQDPIPRGQNITYFFYEARKTLDFWIYAVVWILISFGLFGAGIVVYNKYDIK